MAKATVVNYGSAKSDEGKRERRERDRAREMSEFRVATELTTRAMAVAISSCVETEEDAVALWLMVGEQKNSVLGV